MVSSRFAATTTCMTTLLRFLLVDPALARMRIRIAAIAYLTILVLGSVPGARADIGHVASGVVLHLTAYAGLTMLIYCGTDGSARRRALTAVLAVAAMGAFDEFVQSFFPYRGAAIGDWLVDCSAALGSAAILYLLWPRLNRLALAPARRP
ncbi:VanZ family protein [Massilia sp. PWRC2]|uniref:VanZ family protein n=1 Tax=Massilia sp. PWRC2 TaxID=2804626 RepID=UPI003CE72829